MKKIHVGFLLSYDYELLKHAIPPVYEASDRIFIAIDENLITWSGNKFEVSPSFFEWLKEFDKDNKIELYYDNFYVPSLTTTQMDTRERKMLSDKMGIGNWLIQVDSDEYFIDFEGFVKQLRKYDHYLDNPEKNKIQIAAFWIIIYKYTDKGILYVDKPMKSIFATNYPNYKAFRRTNERVIYLDSLVLHESVARSEEQLRYKLKNWSHNTHVNDSFLDKWLKVDENNYKEFQDFYYIEPDRWKTLDYFPTKDIQEINELSKKSKKLKLTKTFLFFKNFGQWFKFLFK
ncbi:hypothetical protein [Flavobacterium okayamense]|uniref:Glycosyl transferase family 2 n=1 Tax=Flavobacterium okayamense TaxID=2830782 RepID=A0ABM7S7R0_9FLAO|nr:hypothetical protein [Flavobacterium okayamense]BCY28677.1 hypothetical protein KK2020170_15450 [Flavobacterium okayamense]